MIIDCDECAMQHTSVCSDCVLSVLLRDMDRPVVLSSDEHQALGNLADAGLVAPLRLLPRTDDEAAAG